MLRFESMLSPADKRPKVGTALLYLDKTELQVANELDQFFCFF